MGRKVVWLFQRISVLVVEASQARSEDDGCHQCRDASGHVHRSRSGEIDGPGTPERIRGGAGKESVGRPERVGYHGVDETYQKDRVQQVGGHGGAFGDGPSDNGGERTGKGKLKEPLVVLYVVSHEEKVGVAHKGLGTFRVTAAVGKGKSTSPEGETSTARIQKVPKDDILDIFGSNASCTQHGETSLHKVDQSSLKEREIRKRKGRFVFRFLSLHLLRRSSKRYRYPRLSFECDLHSLIEEREFLFCKKRVKHKLFYIQSKYVLHCIVLYSYRMVVANLIGHALKKVSRLSIEIQRFRALFENSRSRRHMYCTVFERIL